MGQTKLWVKPQCLVVVRQGLIKLSEFGEHVATIGISRYQARINLERILVTLECTFGVMHFMEQIGIVEMQGGKCADEAKSLEVSGLGQFKEPQFFVNAAQVGQQNGILGVYLVCDVKVPNGPKVIFELVSNQSQMMYRLKMIGF